MSFLPLSRLSLTLAAACLLAQCDKPATAKSGGAGDDALATVAGQPVTAKDLVAEAEWRQANRQPVPAADVLLEEMVDRLALVERAKQSGIADEMETRRRVESLLIARLRERELDSRLAKVEVSDEEISAAYEERADDYSREAIDRFAILFLAAHDKMSEDARKEVRDRLESALSKSDANPARGGRGPAASGFGALAIEASDDQVSRHRGGDIGWIAADAETRFPAAVIDAGRSLEKGARSGIIESADGYYAIMKTDSRPGGVQPLADVSDKLRNALSREKRREIEEGFLADALSQAGVELNPAAALKVDLPVSTRPASNADTPPNFPAASR